MRLSSIWENDAFDVLGRAETRLRRVLGKDTQRYPDFDIRLKVADCEDMDAWSTDWVSLREEGRHRFFWPERYQMMRDDPHLRGRAALVSMYSHGELCGLADFVHSPHDRTLYFLQTESRPGQHGLRGAVTYAGLQLALEMARMSESGNIGVVGPFYSESQQQRYEAVGFKALTDPNIMTCPVIPAMAGFNYRAYKDPKAYFASPTDDQDHQLDLATDLDN